MTTKDDDVPKLNTRHVYECWTIARDEASRYQEHAHKEEERQRDGWEYRKALLIAKRNAASRIARLIRYGHFNDTDKL